MIFPHALRTRHEAHGHLSLSTRLCDAYLLRMHMLAPDVAVYCRWHYLVLLAPMHSARHARLGRNGADPGTETPRGGFIHVQRAPSTRPSTREVRNRRQIKS